MPARGDLSETFEAHFGDNLPDRPLYLKDLQRRINTSIESLPEKCRNIYKLSREHQLSYKAIAEHLHVSPKTVENQLGIALRKLRAALSEFMILSVSTFLLLAVNI
jgi:RNA polymerase sigma-70 factor (ECF subfamily)